MRIPKILLGLILFYLSITVASADIFINEADSSAEFFELKNNGTDTVDITDWKFSELSGGVEKFWPFANYSSAREIGGGELFILNFSSKLNNTGDTLRIYDAVDNLIDELVIPNLQSGKSYSKNDNGNFEWMTPSPNLENDPNASSSLICTTDSPVKIWEFLPNPSGDESIEEFIEIKNTSVNTIDLSDWQLSDIKGSTTTYIFPSETNIAAGEILVLFRLTTNITLNNSDEGVELKSPNGECDSASFSGSADDDESYAKNKNSEFKWTTPTPGTENIFIPDPNEIECSSESLVQVLSFITNPEGDDAENEFIEIKNISTENIDISNWQISDKEGVTKTFKFPATTIIASEKTMKLWRSNHNDGNFYTNITLNNDRETIEIKSPEGQCHSKTYSGYSASDDEEKIKKLVSTGANLVSPLAQDIEIKILELSFNNSNHDYVKAQFTCKYCGNGALLGGIRLADDNTDYEIPANIYAAKNDFLIFHYTNDELWKVPEKIKNTWHFYVQRSGISATDETIFLLDWKENVFDAVCWANQDGKFSPGEYEDVKNLIEANAWEGDVNNFDESVCFNSNSVKRNFSLLRQNDINQKNSFILTKSSNIDSTKAEDVDISLKEINIFPGNFAQIKLSSNQKIEALKDLTIFINGKKIADLNSLEINVDKINLDTGILQIKDAWNDVILDFRWNGGPDSFKLPHDIPGKIVRTKFCKQRGLPRCTKLAFRFKPAIITEMIYSPDVIISEILPNPNGTDSGNEFVEIFAKKNIDLKKWQLFINGKKIDLADKKLQKGQYLVLDKQNLNINLRNSEGNILLVSSENKYYKFDWQNAPSGQSLALLAYSKQGNIIPCSRSKENCFYMWTAKQTPSRNNIYLATKAKSSNKNTSKEFKDSDHDKIPDDFELANNSDPKKYDKNNSEIVKKYKEEISKKIEIKYDQKPRSIILAGKTEANAKVTIFLHSDLQKFSTQTNKKGEWKMEINSALEKGKHSLDLLVTTAQNLRILKNSAFKFELKKGLREDEIFNLEIISVVPNPVGKDTKNEKVVIKNTSGKSGWIRDWSFKTEKAYKNIPELFFEINEEKEIFDLPNLRNNGDILNLLNFNKKQIDSMAWKNAKEGEIWTKTNRFGAKIKKKKTIKKSKTNKTKSGKFKMMPTIRIGFVDKFIQPVLYVKLKNGITKPFYFAKQESFFMQKKLLKPDTKIQFLTDGVKIISFEILNQKPPALPMAGIKNNFLPLITILVFIFSSICTILLKRKKPN